MLAIFKKTWRYNNLDAILAQACMQWRQLPGMTQVLVKD